MPRPRLPYVVCETSRHGKRVWYFRRGKGKRVRLPNDYGSAEFRTAYEAALAGAPMPHAPRAKTHPGTLVWLFERYRDSARWQELSPSTRTQQSRAMRSISPAALKMPLARIDVDSVRHGAEARKAVRDRVVVFIKCLRAVFGWACEQGFMADNPAMRVRLPRMKSEGHYTWTEDDLRAFCAAWPLGARERLAFDLMLYTGLRRGDIVRLGRQHISNDLIQLPTKKTGARIAVPILPPLAASLAATPSRGLAILETKHGRPFSENGFTDWFRRAARRAGVNGSPHGLRKAAATLAANAGASAKQLNAMLGWAASSAMAEHYTRRADERRLAREAAIKLTAEMERIVDKLPRTQAEGAGIGPNKSRKSST